MRSTLRAERRPPAPALVLAVVSLGVFLAALDQTVVLTALPAMMHDVNIPITRLDHAMWIVTGYLLGYTVGMPLLGRISDVYGHGRIYALSFLVFVSGSALVALSGSLGWLVGARFFQAVGGGAAVPVAMAIVADRFPPARRALALGIIGGVAEAGGVLGPLYGSAITDAWGWRWIFWGNLPLGMAILGLVLYFVSQGQPRVRDLRRVSGRVDYPGGLLLAASLGLLTLALWQEGGQGRPLAWNLGLIAAAAAFLGLFLWREVRASHPLVPLALFRRSAFSAANATNFLVGAALILAMVNVPLLSATVLGRSPMDGGLAVMRLTAMLPLGALAGGFLVRRLGYRLVTGVGLAIGATGFFLMSRWTEAIADPALTRDLFITGFGFGLVIAPIAAAVLNSVGAEHRGIASALVTVMRMVGMMMGLSALSSWGMYRFHRLAGALPLPFPIPGEPAADYSARLAAYQQGVTHAALTLYTEMFLAAGILLLLALVPAWWMRKETYN